MAAGFIDHWSHVAGDPSDPEYTAGQKMMAARKIVYSKTVKQPIWKDMEVVSTDLVEDVAQRKEQDGMDMIVYGGAALVSTLIKHGLIDEFFLFVNPRFGGRRTVHFRPGAKRSKIGFGRVACLRMRHCPAALRVGLQLIAGRTFHTGKINPKS